MFVTKENSKFSIAINYFATSINVVVNMVHVVLWWSIILDLDLEFSFTMGFFYLFIFCEKNVFLIDDQLA